MHYLSWKSMIAFREHFEKKLEGLSVHTHDLSQSERIYILEDSLVLLVRFVIDTLPVCTNAADFFLDYIDHPFLEFPVESGEYYDFVVEELTPNEINFKFDRVGFVEEVERLFNIPDVGLDIQYSRFKGYHRLYWCPDTETTAEQVNRLLPELQLRARYDAWPGELYNYLVYEVEDVSGKLHYAVSYTKSSPKAYINKMGKEYIRTGTFSNDNTRRNYSWDFDNAIRSWKGISRQKQLEEHLRYFVIQQHQKEFDDTWQYGDKLLAMAKDGLFADMERFSYIRPTNRWITEELVYKLAKKLSKSIM